MDTTHPDLAGQVPRPSAERGPELRQLGEFRILRKVGEGGMGAVYLAYHEGQGAQFAIKVLADQLTDNQMYVDRFYREARSGVLLNHPNIVRCLAAGQDQATQKHYLVMEYVDGPSVQSLLEQQGKLAVGDAVHIVLEIARSLEHAHSRNIVHRDIKPGNILITLSGVAKLADLGLAKRTDQTSNLTGTQQIFGTPHYMPYEQAMNARYADSRSDIYALGGTFYHMLTGTLPFTGANHIEVVEKKDRGEYLSAGELRPELPPVLDAIIDKMLARDPKKRYQTASELIVDLERSRLAAPMPSFTDPILALKDPWVRAQMATDDQPTQADLQFRHKPQQTPQEKGRIWFLRHTDRSGKTRRFQATAVQIARQLRAGSLPRSMCASPQRDGTYRPLTAYPEFRNLAPARAAQKNGAGTPNQQPVSSAPPRRLRPWHMFVGVLAGMVMLFVAWYVHYLLS